MKHKLFQAKQYIKHFISSRNNYGHGIHSPFVYNFVQSTLHCEHSFYCFKKIENIRNKNILDKRKINIKDFGTGSDRTSTVSKIAKQSIQSKKNAQLLFKIANYLKAQNIVELGTSLGITSAYLAAHNSKCHCISMEGSVEIAKVAIKNHQQLNIENIEIIVGNIDTTLAPSIAKMENIDLAFIDANHNYASCMEYFEQLLNKVHENSVVVIDDIHWSEGMQKAWNEIKLHPSTRCSIDIYHMGIVFFKPYLHKNCFKIHF